MNGILTNRRSELFSERAFRGLGWICCAHQIAPCLHRVLLFECENYARTARHEFGQLLIEPLACVNRIKSFGLLSCLMDKLHPADTKARVQYALDNCPLSPGAHCVRLYDSKC